MEGSYQLLQMMKPKGRIGGPNGIRTRVTDVRVPSEAFLTDSHQLLQSD